MAKTHINFFNSPDRTRRMVSKDTVTVCNQNGEIISETSTESFSKENEPAFVKLYIQDLAKLSGMTKQETECFYRAISVMSYQNIVMTGGLIKEGLMTSMGIKEPRRFEQLITKLKKREILLPVISEKTGKAFRGMYQINPNICGKGYWRDIKKLRLCIDYDTKGNRLVSTQMDFEDGSNLIIDNQ